MRQSVDMSAQSPHDLQPARIQRRAYAPRCVSLLSAAKSSLRSRRQITRSACDSTGRLASFALEIMNPTTFAFVVAIRGDDSANCGCSAVNFYERPGVRHAPALFCAIRRSVSPSPKGASHQTGPGAARSVRRGPFSAGRSLNVVWRFHDADHATARNTGAHCKKRDRATSGSLGARFPIINNEVLA